MESLYTCIGQNKSGYFSCCLTDEAVQYLCYYKLLSDDVNRVCISDNEDDDYINASHIRLEVDGALCDYIVSQGPLPETTDDFWRMIWQENVTVIVMLTLDMEALKVKCHRYWPDSVDVPIDVCNG